MCFGSLRVHMGSVCFGGLGVHMGSVLYVFWSPGGAYVEGNAEGKVEGNAGGNAEGNAKGNAKGNAEGNAGGIFSLTMVSTPARGDMQYIYMRWEQYIYKYLEYIKVT